MPGGDRTGPMGLGSRTGWGAGYCSGLGAPVFMSAGFGGGFWGGGRGRRNRFYATALTGWQRAEGGRPRIGARWPWGFAITQEHELNSLKAQASYFDELLKDVRTRIDEIEGGIRGNDA